MDWFSQQNVLWNRCKIHSFLEKCLIQYFGNRRKYTPMTWINMNRFVFHYYLGWKLWTAIWQHSTFEKLFGKVFKKDGWRNFFGSENKDKRCQNIGRWGWWHRLWIAQEFGHVWIYQHCFGSSYIIIFLSWVVSAVVYHLNCFFASNKDPIKSCYNLISKYIF